MPINRDQLIEMVDKIPTFQESVHRILALTTSPDCAAKDLVQVIEHDPILTIKVLKLVNSAYFGLSQEVTSVNHSVVYVGINTIKNVAISVATTGALPKNNKAGLNMNRFWAHSLAVGVIAKLLAENKGVGKNEQANYFVGGLLHDIGKVLFAHFIPAEYQAVLHKAESENISLHLAEKELLGFDHSEIGAMVAQKWQLPADLIDSIKSHHRLGKQDSQHCPLSLAIYAANQTAHYIELTKEASESEAENLLAQAAKIDHELPEAVKEWLGWPLSEVCKWLSNLDDEIEKALAFIDLSEGEPTS
ncbi:HDOD domain-containing protein [Alkalimarinus coralli]|uniref:HDOD domain-containing protein n=1 Tax=Alkalimarinus coralli TaxID=2935863 RepID=UPI00202B509A|nr:HDOD domain-containing protein [Alkalimarinus coralli]